MELVTCHGGKTSLVLGYAVSKKETTKDFRLSAEHVSHIPYIHTKVTKKYIVRVAYVKRHQIKPELR